MRKPFQFLSLNVVLLWTTPFSPQPNANNLGGYTGRGAAYPPNIRRGPMDELLKILYFVLRFRASGRKGTTQRTTALRGTPTCSAMAFICSSDIFDTRYFSYSVVT